MTWCEHCRDHYEGTHYDEDGAHLADESYGPTGHLLALEAVLLRFLASEFWEITRSASGVTTLVLDGTLWDVTDEEARAIESLAADE